MLVLVLLGTIAYSVAASGHRRSKQFLAYNTKADIYGKWELVNTTV